MEPGGSLPCSQEPATGLCPEPDAFSPKPHPISQRPVLIVSSHLRLSLLSGLFPSEFTTKILYVRLFSPIYATRHAHLILHGMILLIILGEEYEL
jgi:hypothetical protein